MMMKLLDLFCGAGGAGEGYRLAGFEVTGVDIKPQPRYKPGRFIQADALEYLAAHGHKYDVIHASPPCQRYSEATPLIARDLHPDLIKPTRDLIRQLGNPYVIENVSGAAAEMDRPFMLCGLMFPELRVYRHRFFESSIFMLTPAHRPHRDNCHGNNMISNQGFVNVFGGGGLIAYKRKAMGINWMTRNELAQAIPPAYTEWIGRRIAPVIGADHER